jgi:hypothetical protein
VWCRGDLKPKHFKLHNMFQQEKKTGCEYI